MWCGGVVARWRGGVEACQSGCCGDTPITPCTDLAAEAAGVPIEEVVRALAFEQDRSFVLFLREGARGGDVAERIMPIIRQLLNHDRMRIRPRVVGLRMILPRGGRVVEVAERSIGGMAGVGSEGGVMVGRVKGHWW